MEREREAECVRARQSTAVAARLFSIKLHAVKTFFCCHNCNAQSEREGERGAAAQAVRDLVEMRICYRESGGRGRGSRQHQSAKVVNMSAAARR